MLSIIIGIYLHFFFFILIPYEITILKNNYNYSLLNFLIDNYLKLFIGGNFSTNIDYRSIFSGIEKNDYISFVASIAWDANIATESNQISNIGNIIYTNYSLWLILTSLILLLTLTGTMVIITKSDKDYLSLFPENDELYNKSV